MFAAWQPVRYPQPFHGEAPFRPMATAEIFDTEKLVGLVLGDAEREALVRVLYVVKDNFWLDEVEESLLERLLEKGES